MAIKSKDKIYFDADCISSFFLTDSEHILISLYGNKIVIPSMVANELKIVHKFEVKLNHLQSRGLFNSEQFNIQSEEFKIFMVLYLGDSKHPKIGKGEASVIALAKCNESMMASNNLKDISYYIRYYKLKNITCADILLEAVNKKVILKTEAENLWKKMVSLNRKMPYDTFNEWLLKSRK